MGANESAFGPSPKALEAMREGAAFTHWYGDPESAVLRAALAEKHGCEPDNLVVAGGIDELLGLLVRAYVGSGGIAIATRGTYPTFAFHVAGYGARLETVPYREDGTLDIIALARAAGAYKPGILYLANPDNPSGTFLPRHSISQLRESLHEEVLLVLDEAYADFVPEAELPPDPWMAVDPDGLSLHAGVVRLRTFSKAYGLAGARIGYAIGSRNLVATLQKIRLHYGVNRSAQLAALAALDDRAFIASVVEAVAQGREDYYRLAERLGLRAIESRTNFVTFEIGSREAAEAAVAKLLELGVFVRKPAAAPLDGFIRVSVGLPAERALFAELLPEALGKVSAKLSS